ncbi:hypothetical protein [Streptomyces doebereineriae]|uniref:Uncharacterized protein n=1 Tax=Streptomyces doebereineriae TaxID=3075528 RepID=A0ABU2VAM8_9ACTN|nr:hypothetical protein [Streptomyces sp. DSM 41640]MDT0482617.1 hypothetical protein [Streptomyces sp. DSM 41640]
MPPTGTASTRSASTCPRSGVLASWPVDDFLALLGACRRDLAELRGVFGELLAGCRGRADAGYFGTEEETERVQQLLERLSPVAGPGCCPVCIQALPESTGRPRKFCTTWCRDRDKVLRRRGLLPAGPRTLLPAPRKQNWSFPTTRRCEPRCRARTPARP